MISSYVLRDMNSRLSSSSSKIGDPISVFVTSLEEK
jgi:hypothetical protein